jgi:glycosyltransferase involved in cell wall biosynthesis
VITEAMASGLPVVSTDIAGIPEQVVDSENGFLIQPGDVDGLVDRLERLIESAELREEFGSVGRKRVEQFSIEAMVSDLDAIYQELLT